MNEICLIAYNHQEIPCCFVPESWVTFPNVKRFNWSEFLITWDAAEGFKMFFGGGGGSIMKSKYTDLSDQVNSTHREAKDAIQVHHCSKTLELVKLDIYMFCIYLYILYVCMMSTLCLHWQGAQGPMCPDCPVTNSSRKDASNTCKMFTLNRPACV